ncbi:MAG: helix-turn-helix transcriptional regulator [Oscillospiraceae bacterium]|jgi:transcriptional regulator with XRE-family HTH domain|nr:helix-turn-helix transcriptional regulator [Oscillospiraceae bacterium]
MTEKELGLAIRAARLRKGISQEQLAEQVTITPTHEKHIESGHRGPSVEVLFNITQALDLSLDRLLFPLTGEREGQLRDVNVLLNQCDSKELRIMEDVLQSLLKNKK